MHKKTPFGTDPKGRNFCYKLFLVLIDFLEVLVSIHLQLTAGSLIAGNNAVLVQLQSGDGPGMVHAAFHAVAQSTSLVVTADEQQDLLGIADGADANGQSGLGNLIGIVIEETGIDDEGILGQGTDAGAGSEAGEGFVKGDVTVNAAAAQEQINAAIGSNLIFIALALSFQIFSHTIENVDIFGRNIDVVKEIVVHKVPVALIMLTRQANVFIHIKGNYVLKGHFTGLVLFNQTLINAQRRGTGGQAKNKGTIALVIVDGISNVLCSPCTHFVVIVLNNQLHIAFPHIGFMKGSWPVANMLIIHDFIMFVYHY